MELVTGLQSLMNINSVHYFSVIIVEKLFLGGELFDRIVLHIVNF